MDQTIDYKRFEAQMKNRPHVVVLGAGASVAAIPNGDANGKKISAMDGFIERLGMGDIITSCDLYTNSDNLEDIYMELYERDAESSAIHNARVELERRIEQYFNSFQIPDEPTVYDFLILSLTKKDLIATFNWDPLLMQAYQRCSGYSKSLPELAFLHGTVAVGICDKDKRAGIVGKGCDLCGKVFTQMPLLYPIKDKDYTSNRFIADSWRVLQHYMKYAYFMTIFGYSAPKSDVGAISMLKSAWGDIDNRNLEEIEVIDIADEEEVHRSWEDFIYTHHYSFHKCFFDSSLGRFPRRTCDVLFDNKLKNIWIPAGKRGFREGMDFYEINEFIAPLELDELSKGNNEILNNPYLMIFE